MKCPLYLVLEQRHADTDDLKEKNLNDALAVAKGMSTVKEISGMIRVA